MDQGRVLSNRVSRRAALGVGLATGLAAWRPPVATAIDPIKRNGEAKFKFSLAAYSYRNLLKGNPAKLTLFDFVSDCAAAQLEGTELTSYYFPSEVTPEYLRKLKRHCFQLGLDISGTAVGNDFGHPPGPKRDEQLALVKRWVDYAEILGAPVIRVFAGHVKRGQSPEVAHKLMVEGLEEVCDYAGQHGVHLALENHGGPTATPQGLLALVKAVQSPWFGVNLDTGNFHSDDVYGDLAKAAPYAINVQVKVTVSNGSGKSQPTDYNRLHAILSDVGYRGYIVLEYEEKADPRAECPRHIARLRSAFAAS